MSINKLYLLHIHECGLTGFSTDWTNKQVIIGDV